MNYREIAQVIFKGTAGIGSIELLDSIQVANLVLEYSTKGIQIIIGLLTIVSLLITLRKNLAAPAHKPVA